MKRCCALLALLALCFTAAPAPSQETSRHAFTHPHELRMAMAEDVVGLNLHLNAQTLVEYLSELTMAWLLRTDAHEGYRSELATTVPSAANGGISADGKTITFHLRHDAKWSDGVPFTSADVAFTTKLALDPATNEVSREGFDRIAKVDTPDPYTVVFHLSKPYANIIAIYASGGGVPVLPKHLLEHVANINTAGYNALPVGIGPFAYKAWKRGDEIDLVANPLYFRGRPKLDRIVYKIIPDRNTTLAQLQTHEIDLWIRVPGAYLERATSIPNIKLLRTESFGWNHLDFVTSHPVVADPVVRRALRMALDRETLRVKIGHSLSMLSETIYGPAHPAHVTTPIPMVPFDIAAANQMLDQAGWKRGPDGIRTKNGVRLNISVGLPSGAPDADQQIELIRSWWSQLGVMLDVRHFAEALFFAPYQSGGIVFTGKADIFFFGWTTSAFGDATNLFACDKFPPAGQNVLHYCDKDVDAAMAAQLLEYDPQKRRAFTDFVQRKIFTDAPTIVLSIPRAVYAFNDDLKGFAPNVNAPFDDMTNVDL